MLNFLLIIITILVSISSCNEKNKEELLTREHREKKELTDFKNYLIKELKTEIIDDKYFNILCSYNYDRLHDNYFEGYNYILDGGDIIFSQFFLYRHIFCNDNKDIVIEYPDSRYDGEIFTNRIIIIIRKKLKKACYIEWKKTSKSKHIYRQYLWQINNNTDKVETNINNDLIKGLFPEFKGVTLKTNYKKIEVFTNIIKLNNQEIILSPPYHEFYRRIKIMQ